jgi:two-component system, LytTR family, response regulator LytT
MAALNILIVEDEFLVAADIEESLLSLGYKVQNCVASGLGAIAEVEKNLPDIILMDIVLKGEMNGIEAATIINQKHNVPIIYLTANADIGTVEKAKVSLPYGYIIKPFTEKELQTNIEIARFKFENDIKSKIESDQFNKFFELGKQDKQQLIVDSEKGLEKISIPDVYYIEQDGDECQIHLLQESIVVKRSLAELERRFPSDVFIRVSNDHLVNTGKIFMAKFPEIIIADKMSVITVEDKYKELLESRL